MDCEKSRCERSLEGRGWKKDLMMSVGKKSNFNGGPSSLFKVTFWWKITKIKVFCSCTSKMSHLWCYICSHLSILAQSLHRRQVFLKLGCWLQPAPDTCLLQIVHMNTGYTGSKLISHCSAWTENDCITLRDGLGVKNGPGFSPKWTQHNYSTNSRYISQYYSNTVAFMAKTSQNLHDPADKNNRNHQKF